MSRTDELIDRMIEPLMVVCSEEKYAYRVARKLLKVIASMGCVFAVEKELPEYLGPDDIQIKEVWLNGALALIRAGWHHIERIEEVKAK